MDKNKKMYIAEVLGKLLILVTYGWMAYGLLMNFSLTGRMSSIFFLLFVLIVILFVLLRPIPKEASMSFYDWMIAMFGTWLPLLLRPGAESQDIFVLQGVQLVGIIIALTGLVSLNKSFGLVAANRGIKTSGFYKYIRHPIYLGYCVSYGAFWGQNITVLNTGVLLLWVMFEVLRIFAEEEFLSKDPAYAEYMKKVRWRILPGVF